MVLLDETVVTEKIRLGPNELKLLFTLEEKGKNVFLFSDANRILGSTNASVKNVLYRLRNKGRIEDIERGKYLLVPARAGYDGTWSEVPFLIIPHLINNYYIGFWTALNYWGLTEQVPRTVFVVITKRKRDMEYGQTRFEFVTFSEKKFFGFVEEKAGGGTFNISSAEKTLLDCLLYPKYCGGLDEVVKGVWSARERLDFVKVLGFSRKMGVSVVMRRLGYVLELLGIENKISSEIAGIGFKGFMWLDPLGPKKVLGYSKRYGLLINRAESELISWMGY